MDRGDREFVFGTRWMAVEIWREGNRGRAPRWVVVEEEERTGRMDQEGESSMWLLANQGTQTIFDRRLGDD
jgi:hypothetical protein